MSNSDDLRGRFRSDYSNPQISSRSIPARQPIFSPPPEQSSSSSKKNRKKSLIILPIVLIFILGGLVGAYYFTKVEKNPVPPSVKAVVSSPLYYPDKLPEDFVVDEKSYSVSGEIVSFHAANDKNQKILFTIQPRPPTFDYQTFYQKGLSGTEQFTTPDGQAAIGRAETKLIGNLVTGDTWVIVTSDTDKIGSQELRLVLANLKRSPDN